jgi:16S rRNA (adenine1518-N6/adenine1519-N6)-dimethyltransferase
MSLLHETKLICKKYNIKPSRKRGQNFLISEEVYNQIIDAANLSKNDTVLEVGSGFGILTRLLCGNAKKVIAVELDKKIFDYLKTVKEIEKLNNLELLNKNILDLKITELPQGKFKVVANLPYNITSIFLRKFLPLIAAQKLDEMVLMLQKEVAERIIAKPGNMSLLSLSAQFYSDPEIFYYVDKKNFWPEPKIDSAIIKIKPINNTIQRKLRLKVEEKDFFQIARIGFSAKRKKLANNLANGLHKKQSEILPFLQESGLSPNVRAQELGVKDWINLAKSLVRK